MQILHGYGIYNHEKYVPEEESGELLNDAMYARNRKVEELFNVKFAEEDVTGCTIANRVKTFVTSGDNAIDVYFSVGNPTLGPEFCYDYTEMPGINLDRAW